MSEPVAPADEQDDADPVLSVRDVSVEFATRHGVVRAVQNVSFDIHAGSILGIVGESGSGKSVTARAIMGMVPEPGKVTSGEIFYRGTNLLELPPKEMRKIRGRHIAMVFQDPQAVLNPVMKVGKQIAEALIVHGADKKTAAARSLELLEMVGIPDPPQRLNEYPHQFSGGMRQRVVIAIALANRSSVLIADEPTTALDVTIQAQILRLLAELRDELGVSVIMITHDMGVVAGLCDEVMVMYAGRQVERGGKRQILREPTHPYTLALMKSVPRVGVKAGRLTTIPGSPVDPTNLPDGCAFHSRCEFAEPICPTEQPLLEPVGNRAGHFAACFVTARDGRQAISGERPDTVAQQPRVIDTEPLLEVENLSVDVARAQRPLFRKHHPVHAADRVSMTIAPGETVGLVGESGCGKSTFARALVGINPTDNGTIILDGVDITAFGKDEAELARQTIQYVFQDPYASLNPRRSIRQTIEEALAQRQGAHRSDFGARAEELMKLVGLGTRHLDLYPKSFSGGQRQRIGIARALAVEPKLLICDEPVSALDVSIQAQIVNLLADLRDELDLAMLFIAHDLSVVRQLSDRVAVMYLGTIVETGPVSVVYGSPRHPYTSVLLSSTPTTDLDSTRVEIPVHGETPSPANPPSGCRFRTRCPVGPITHPERSRCGETTPVLTEVDGRQVACHFPEDLLAGAASGSVDSATVSVGDPEDGRECDEG